MKQLLLLNFFIAFFLIGSTQIVESRVAQFISSHSIDTFLVYSVPCSGSVYLDSCQYDDPHFLFFKKKDNYYLKRFDYCTTYQPLLLDANNPLTYYLEDKAVIDTEEIKPPTYIEVKKKRNKVDSLLTISSVSHSCYYKFQLSFGKEPVYKYANSYDLEFKVFDNGKDNMYYTYNQQTKLKALIDLTSLLIKNLNADKKFKTE